MPTLRPLNEREAAYVAKQGQDPEAYAFDEASGEAVIKPEFEYLTKADSPTREFIKGGVRSVRDTAANALDFLGASLRTSAEDPRALVRDLAGLPPKENPKSSALEGIGRSVRSIAEDSLEADPRSPKAALAGEVSGQVLQFLVPALAGAKALSAASVAESMLSGAEGVRKDYAAAQEKAGTPVSEEEALARGAAYIPVSMAEQAILNKVAPFIAPFSGRGAGERLAKTALKPMRFALDEAVRGGGGEAVDSVTSQLMGSGEVDSTQVAVEALAGGLTQGGAAGVAARNKSAGDKAAEVKKRFEEKKAKATAPAEADARVPEFAKQMVSEGLLDPNVPDEVERVASAPTLEKAQQVFEQTVAVKAMLASQARNMKHDPINPTPVDKVFEQMRSKGLPTTPDMLHKLWDVYDGKPENAEKVEKAARFMADSLAPQQPVKREFVADAVVKQVAEIGKIDSAIQSVSKKIDDIDKQLKEITSAPPTGDAGDLVLRFNKTQRAQRQVLVGQLNDLITQKELLVQQGVSPEPAVEPVPRQRQLGQGDPGTPQGPAIPMPQANASVINAPSIVSGSGLGSQLPPMDSQPAAPRTTAKMRVRQRKISPHVQEAQAAVAQAEQRMQALREQADVVRKTATVTGTGREVVPLLQAIDEEIAAEEDFVVNQKKVLQGGSVPREVREFMSGATLPGMEGEQGLPFSGASEIRPGTLGEVQPVPENAAQIAAQYALTLDPASTKKATLVTPGSPVSEIPAGLESFEAPHGLFVFNPGKMTRAEADAAVAGKVVDGRVFGYGNPPSTEGGTHAVTTDVGPVKGALSEIVRSPEEAAAAAQAQALAAPGSTPEIRPAGEALTDRAQDLDEGNGQPVNPRLKNPEVRYSAIFPPAFEKFFEDKVWPTLRRNGVTKDPISLIHAITQADIGRIVRSNPLGALLARYLDTLYVKRTGRENRKLNELAALESEHGKFLDAPEFVAWVHDSLDGKSDSVASLPAEMQDAGRAFRDWIKSFHAEQNKLGIGVLEFERGRLKYRPARDIEGYTPVGVDKAVYDAMEEGGEAWDKYRKDWFDHWKAVKGTLEGAEEALASFKAPFAASRVTGGEPLFGAVRVQAGIGLPKSWRSAQIRDGLSTYIHQWATDLTWGEVMESNPLMRRALGITHDAMGKKTIETDANARPSPAEWEAIIDTGAKMDAPWLDTLDPDMPLDMIVRGDSAFGQSLYHNYTQRPLQKGVLGKLGETANQASAAMMMQHFSKARNILQSASTVLDYALDADTAGPVFSSLIDSIVAPAQAIRSAEAAGSQGMDIMRQETANAMADGVYKTLRGFRKYTGLQAMDAYAKALAYNIAEAAVRAQHSALGTESPLIREFGPVDKIDEEAVIRQTAAAIANRTDPSFDVRSLPSTMIPQNRSFMGNMLRLMTWSVGRFNNWYQDVWRPAVRGERYDRLLKSLIIGTIGAVATQELFALLQDKMPRDLSVREWSKLPEDKQYSEVAPMVFGYLQAQGAMGILGDLAYAGSRVAAGRSPTQDYTRPMVPAFLVMRDTADTVWDFLTYARDERGWDVDGVDIMKLGVEMAKSMQTFRAVVNRGDAWLPERLQAEAADAKDRREMRVFEELEKRSARTGEPLSPSTLRGKAAAAFTRDPFSLGKELKFRQGEDLEAILPSLVEAAKGGQEFRLPKEMRTRSYYEDIARRRGTTLAEQVLAADLQSENERTRKGALVRGLNRVADNAKR